jgi:hypothetical protein
MALDPRRTARTAVLTPVGFGVLAFDQASARGKKANAAVEERVAPLTKRLKSLLDEARAEAKPAAQQLEQRFASLARKRTGVAPAAPKASPKTSAK